MEVNDYKKTVYTIPSNTQRTLFIGVHNLADTAGRFVTISEQTNNDLTGFEFELEIGMTADTAHLASDVFREIAEAIERDEK